MVFRNFSVIKVCSRRLCKKLLASVIPDPAQPWVKEQQEIGAHCPPFFSQGSQPTKLPGTTGVSRSRTRVMYKPGNIWRLVWLLDIGKGQQYPLQSWEKPLAAVVHCPCHSHPPHDHWTGCALRLACSLPWSTPNMRWWHSSPELGTRPWKPNKEHEKNAMGNSSKEVWVVALACYHSYGT